MRPSDYIQQLSDLCILLPAQGDERILPLAALENGRVELLSSPEGDSAHSLRLLDAAGVTLVHWRFADYQEAESLRALLLLVTGRKTHARPSHPKKAARLGRTCLHIAGGLLLGYLALIGLSTIATDSLRANPPEQPTSADTDLSAWRQADSHSPASAMQGGAGIEEAQEAPSPAYSEPAAGEAQQQQPSLSEQLFNYSCE